MKKKVNVIVNVRTEQGKWGLDEIRGLKEETEIVGTYNDENESVEITWNGNDAVLWVGENCDIIAHLQIEYSIADRNSLECAAMSENFFGDLDDAKRFKAENGGYLFVGASWIDAKTMDYMVAPFWAKTEKNAIARLNKFYF